MIAQASNAWKSAARAACVSALCLGARPAPAEEPDSMDINLGDGVVIEMVRIPNGGYAMGSLNGEADEQPVRVFTFRQPLWMSKCEITQEQYEKVTGGNPSTFRNPRHPVEGVSYQDITEFLKRLMSMDVVASNFVPRLPTEAEWEYACRAGTTGEFHSGSSDALDAVAWYAANSGGATHPVGEKQPNAFGLHDMHGNVWEWCNDWYVEAFYRIGLADVDAAGPRSGVAKVLRGGSWRNSPPYCRSANRFRYRPWARDYTTGFRIVIVLQ